MDTKERLEKIKAAEIERDRAYITLFKAPKPTQAQITSARKRVLKDFDDILRARIHLPDEKGHYDPIRAAIEDGGRKLIVNILSSINRSFDEEDAKHKPTVKKTK
jgi:hypothetical protein